MFCSTHIVFNSIFSSYLLVFFVILMKLFHCWSVCSILEVTCVTCITLWRCEWDWSTTADATGTTLSQKGWCWILAITLPSVNRLSQFFYCWKEDEISNKTYITIFSLHVSHVATLLCEMQTFEYDTLNKLGNTAVEWIHCCCIIPGRTLYASSRAAMVSTCQKW